MDKYYIESGTLRCIVSAQSARRAAVWAVHRAMAQIMPLDQASMFCPQEQGRRLDQQATMVLGESITVSQRGYRGSDAVSLKTFEVVTQWNELLNALDRLEELLGRV